MRAGSINSYTITDTSSLDSAFSIADVEIDAGDFIITIARDEEKIAAVLFCLSSCVKGHTIRTVRQCATRYTPIGERTVKRIIRVLAYELSLVRYDTKLRKWVPTPVMPQFRSYKHALEYVLSNKIRYR